MIRHALAPVLPSAAIALGIPRTLGSENSRQRVLARAEGPSFPGVTLTFDDGPHPEGTPAMLELLARAGAQAIFFVVGEQVTRRPELVARIAAAGHLVGLHGHQHRLQLRLSAAEVQADLVRGTAAIEAAIGLTPVWHRPPYGIYSDAGLGAARAAGMRPLLWSRWGRDWRKFTTPRKIAARATRGIGGGDVILLHDADFYSAKNSHARTAAALALIMNELAERKLDTVLPI
jgi:peptidoglycan/xylan/chitin deacetylase (PgdA/CDA1 family)